MLKCLYNNSEWYSEVCMAPVCLSNNRQMPSWGVSSQIWTRASLSTWTLWGATWWHRTTKCVLLDLGNASLWEPANDITVTWGVTVGPRTSSRHLMAAREVCAGDSAAAPVTPVWLKSASGSDAAQQWKWCVTTWLGVCVWFIVRSVKHAERAWCSEPGCDFGLFSLVGDFSQFSACSLSSASIMWLDGNVVVSLVF